MSAEQPTCADKNVQIVRDRLLQRSRFGLIKYGVTTDMAGLSREQWLRHLRDEMLDAAVYITALLEHGPAGDA